MTAVHDPAAREQMPWPSSWKGGLAGFLLLLLMSAPAAAQVGEMSGQRAESGGVARFEERPAALERQFRRAQMAWRGGGNLLEAKARLDQVLGERPDDVEACKLRAEVLLEMGRPAEALADAAHVTDLRPRDGMAQLLRAEAAREAGQHADARRALDRSADYLPEEAEPHTRFSWNAMLLDRLAQAEAFARVAVALDSSSAPAREQLARVFVKRGHDDEAASVLARGLRAAVLTPRAIREDDVLRTLIGHARLEEWLRR